MLTGPAASDPLRTFGCHARRGQDE